MLLTLELCQLQGQTESHIGKLEALSDFSRSVRALTQKVSPAVVQVLVSGYGQVGDGEGQQVSGTSAGEDNRAQSG